MRINKRGFTLIEILVCSTIVLIFAGIIISASTTHACGGWFESSCDSASGLQQQEQYTVTGNQARMEKAVPIPQLDNSLERANVAKRLQTFNDPNKISYIYLISFGKVMSFYTIKGKVTSGSKRLTSTQRLIDAGCGQYCSQIIAESPELDGTYGSSNAYIFFWTTDGVYVQWSGDYMLADQPLQLTTQPELVRAVK